VRRPVLNRRYPSRFRPTLTKLERLIRGENPMLMKIKTNGLIWFGRRGSNPLDLGANSARACTRAVASPTSGRSPRHGLSPGISRDAGSSGDDRSGYRSRDRPTDCSRERSWVFQAPERGLHIHRRREPAADVLQDLLAIPVADETPARNLIRRTAAKRLVSHGPRRIRKEIPFRGDKVRVPRWPLYG
jgi:hypothetical protein